MNDAMNILLHMTNEQKSFINNLLKHRSVAYKYPCSDDEQMLVDIGFVKAHHSLHGFIYTPTNECCEFFKTREHLLVENYTGLVEQASEMAGDPV